MSIAQLIKQYGYKINDFEEYVDIKSILLDYVHGYEIVKSVVAIIPDGIQAIAGIELGGAILAIRLGIFTGLPTVIIRKDGSVIGNLYGKSNILLVEDVIITGYSVIKAIEALITVSPDCKITIIGIVNCEVGGIQIREVSYITNISSIRDS